MNKHLNIAEEADKLVFLSVFLLLSLAPSLSWRCDKSEEEINSQGKKTQSSYFLFQSYASLPSIVVTMEDALYGHLEGESQRLNHNEPDVQPCIQYYSSNFLYES